MTYRTHTVRLWPKPMRLAHRVLGLGDRPIMALMKWLDRHL